MKYVKPQNWGPRWAFEKAFDLKHQSPRNSHFSHFCSHSSGPSLNWPIASTTIHQSHPYANQKLLASFSACCRHLSMVQGETGICLTTPNCSLALLCTHAGLWEVSSIFLSPPPLRLVRSLPSVPSHPINPDSLSGLLSLELVSRWSCPLGPGQLHPFFGNTCHFCSPADNNLVGMAHSVLFVFASPVPWLELVHQEARHLSVEICQLGPVFIRRPENVTKLSKRLKWKITLKDSHTSGHFCHFLGPSILCDH